MRQRWLNENRTENTLAKQLQLRSTEFRTERERKKAGKAERNVTCPRAITPVLSDGATPRKCLEDDLLNWIRRRLGPNGQAVEEEEADTSQGATLMFAVRPLRLRGGNI